MELRVALWHGTNAIPSVRIVGEAEVEARGVRRSPVGRLEITAGIRPRVRIDGLEAALDLPLTIRPRDRRKLLELNGSQWRGALEVWPEGSGFRIVNRVSIEDYVAGVVANEMFAHPEAFKVQAVISRTFALYVARVERRWQHAGFDVSVSDQVYRGVAGETPLARHAVQATFGEVLTYSDRPMFAAYDANAGGHTETVDVVWPGSVRSQFPYLRAVASPYDRSALELPGYEDSWRWSRFLTWRQIEQKLRESGFLVTEVRSIQALRGGASQRLMRVEVAHSEGRLRLDGADPIRTALGLPGARAEVRPTSDGIWVEGFGLGHGVGLSQHGAWGLARAGYSYRQILGHYYHGAVIQVHKDAAR
ncbi:MAG: SpoIID/LytB domain-containing protein [Armatimonadota bacterium]|nr:SpoIID/LytB domain-containing protein [Armatimonadota bacterium]